MIYKPGLTYGHVELGRMPGQFRCAGPCARRRPAKWNARKAEHIVKGWIVLSGIVLALLTSLPATAQHGGGKRLGQGGGPGRQTPPPQMPARDAGGPKRDASRDARMTPEQRRQLRRDVNDHGRDIYRDRSGQNRP